MSGAVEENELNSPPSHSEVFNTVSGSKRKLIVGTVMESGVSLGMVDPTTGRYICHCVQGVPNTASALGHKATSGIYIGDRK